MNKKLVKENKENRKLFNSLKFVMVVQGYHFGMNNKHSHKPYVFANKSYNFKVDKHTYHLLDAKPGNTATVLTKNGKAFLYITKIIKARGSIAKKQAKKLQPVITFRGKPYGIIAKLIKRFVLKK